MTANAYSQALANEAAVARNALMGNGVSRRLGQPDKPIQDTRTEEQKMTDKAIVKQEQALEVAARWTDIEVVRGHVVAAYAGKFDNAQLNAMTHICFTMGLDPSPAVGHIYAYQEGREFRIVIGYQGYMFKANQQHKFFVYPPRAMTIEERESHGLKQGEIGAVAELIKIDDAMQAKALGLPIPRIVGSAVWKPQVRRWDKNTNGYKMADNNPPNGRTGMWVAEKNALKDALRKLGIGFGSFTIPNVDGFAYDPDYDSFTQQLGDGNQDGPAESDHDIIEGDFLPTDAQELSSKRADVQNYGVEVCGKQWAALRLSLIKKVNPDRDSIDEMTSDELDRMTALLDEKRDGK